MNLKEKFDEWIDFIDSKKKIIITTSMMIGEKIHHQEIVVNLKSLRKRRIRNITVIIPTPDELDLLIFLYFSC